MVTKAMEAAITFASYGADKLAQQQCQPLSAKPQLGTTLTNIPEPNVYFSKTQIKNAD